MKVWLETTSKPANKVVEKQQTDKHVDLTRMQSPLMVKVTESSDLQMPTQTWHIYYKHIIFQYLSFLFLNFKGYIYKGYVLLYLYIRAANNVPAKGPTQYI